MFMCREAVERCGARDLIHKRLTRRNGSTLHTRTNHAPERLHFYPIHLHRQRDGAGAVARVDEEVDGGRCAAEGDELGAALLLGLG